VEQETPKGPVGRFKLSRGKKTYPYAKQVWRQHGPDGTFVKDVIGRANERLPGEPLLVPVLQAGQLVRPLPALDNSRARCAAQVDRLPKLLLSQEPAPPYSVQVSDQLERDLCVLALRPLKESACLK
jgi:nicotinate phosphoribosyltransferase